MRQLTADDAPAAVLAWLVQHVVAPVVDYSTAHTAQLVATAAAGLVVLVGLAVLAERREGRAWRTWPRR